MRKIRAVLILGIWVAVLPYLGFPYLWKNILFSISGLGFIYLSFVFYREFKLREEVSKIFDNFRENSDFGSAA